MNLLITGAWAGAKDHIGEIEALGHTVRFMQQEKDPLPCEPDWAEGVVCNGLFLYHRMEEFKNLRFIQLTSAGFDRVDMDYVNAQGIEIHNARGVYVSGVLELYKQARFFLENQQARRWEKHRGLLELFGRTVTIVGCGSVGTECAKRFKAFGCRVTGVDIAPRRDDAYDAMLPIEKLDEALPASDVLVLTVPLTKATERLIDARRLELMKDAAVVVNISRGRVIDENSLTAALLDGRLAGAVLDVFENEPLPASSHLWDLPNAILSPHNSFVGDGNGERLQGIILNSIRRKAL